MLISSAEFLKDSLVIGLTGETAKFSQVRNGDVCSKKWRKKWFVISVTLPLPQGVLPNIGIRTLLAGGSQLASVAALELGRRLLCE